MTPDFWRNKNVFITGHTGFKGSWLTLLLGKMGSKITGYALEPPTSPELYGIAEVAKGINALHGDIRDPKKLTEALQSANPEIVLHLAAQSLVRLSYDDPRSTYETNVMGTFNLLESVRQTPSVKVVVHVSSDKCYENLEQERGYIETDRLGGYDPYSSSKGCTEILVSALGRSYFAEESSARIASGRAGNVFGGGDWALDRLIPDCVRATRENQPIRIRNPRSIRPWQYVLEPLSGYVELAEHLSKTPNTTPGEGWNFGPRRSDEKPVQWIVEQFIEFWGNDARWERDGTPQPHEAKTLRLNCDKADKYLGWQPRTNLQTALKWTVEWYREHANGGDMRALCLDQIQRFIDA